LKKGNALMPGVSAVRTIREEDNRRRTNDSLGRVAEARSLQRKLVFWQRTAWLLIGLVLLIVVVAWQRTTVRRRECRQALEHYAGAARTARLDQETTETLASQWRQLGRGPVNYSSRHYALIVHNWLQTLGAEQSLPIVVCRDSHAAVLSRGRHVLFREAGGMRVEWLVEEEAASIVDRARRD
jgi:hypothetical protein